MRGHPEPGRGWWGQTAGRWKALVGASVTTENGHHAGEGTVTEPQMSPGHCSPGEQEAQTAASEKRRYVLNFRR